MPRDPRPGPPLRRGERLTAEWLARASEGVVPLWAEPPLMLDPSSSGNRLWLDEVPDEWARVTVNSGGGLYKILRLDPATGGAWADGPKEEVARESQGSASVTVGMVVRASFDRSADLWFFEGQGC